MAFTHAIVTQSLTATGGGTTDFTSSGFGTPDAAVLIYNSARSGANPGAGLSCGVGLWDGTNQRGVSVTAADAVGISGTARYQRDDYIAPIGASGSSNWAAGFQASAITDGIRLTMAVDNTTNPRYATVLLLKGISAKVLTFTPNSSQNGTATCASLGFAPGALIALSIGHTANSANSGSARTTGAVFSFGAALSGGTHRMAAWASEHTAADSDPTALFSESRLAAEVAAGALGWSLEVTSWGSDDFTATTRDAGTGGDTVYVLALGGADLAAAIGTITTATSTGAVDTATTGVDPDVLLLAMTASDTAGSIKTDAQASSIGFGFANATVQAGFACVDEDAAATMNAESEYSATDALLIRASTSGTGSVLVSADAAMGAEEFTLDYSVADATARKGWYLALGQAVGGGGGAAVSLLGGLTRSNLTQGRLVA